MSLDLILCGAMAVALSVSALGFIRVVYFVSLGYGASVSAISLGMLLLAGRDASWAALAHGLLLLLYGVRLTGFLIWRERQPAYRRELAEIQARSSVSLAKKFAIWFGVSLLYVLMALPGVLHLQSASNEVAGVTVFGLVLALSGLGLESIADRQKSIFKRLHPSRFCDWKLYRVVRCPNYFGEIVFWVGSFTAGVAHFHTWWAWVGASLGLLCIVLIMIGAAKRLESKQEDRYGSQPEYQQYVANVPVLFPWVPVYSLKNVRVYLE